MRTSTTSPLTIAFDQSIIDQWWSVDRDHQCRGEKYRQYVRFHSEKFSEIGMAQSELIESLTAIKMEWCDFVTSMARLHGDRCEKVVWGETCAGNATLSGVSSHSPLKLFKKWGERLRKMLSPSSRTIYGICGAEIPQVPGYRWGGTHISISVVTPHLLEASSKTVHW